MGVAGKLYAAVRLATLRRRCEMRVDRHCIFRPMASARAAVISEDARICGNMMSSFPLRSAKFSSSCSCSMSYTTAVEPDDEEEHEEFPARAEDEELEAVVTELVNTIVVSSRTVNAVDSLKEWESQGNEITRPLLDMVIAKLVRKSKSSLALKIFEWMLKEKPVELKDTDKYMRLVVACMATDLKKIDAFLEGFDPAEKTEKVYVHLLIAYAAKNKISKSEEAWKILKTDFKPIRAISFNHMMLMYMRLGRHNRLPEVYSEMKQLNVEPNFLTYHILLRVEHQLGDFRKEVRKNTKLKMRSMNPEIQIRSTVEKMVTMYAFLGDGDGVEKTWDCLMNYNGRPDKIEKAGIQAFEMVGRADKVEEIFRQSKDPEKLHYHMIRFYAERGKMSKAKQLLPQVAEDPEAEKPSFTNFNLVILGYLKAKKVDEAFEMLKMTVDRIRDYSSHGFYKMFVSVMSGFVETKNIDSAEQLMKLCIEKKCAKDAKIFNELLKVYCNAGVVAMGVRERMVGAGVEADDESYRLFEQIKRLKS